MAHCREVIDLVGFYFLDDSNEIRRIREIPVVQSEAKVFFVGILIQVIDSIGI